MEPTIVKWVDPPKQTRGPGAVNPQWVPIKEELQQHPGEWALIYEAVPPNVLNSTRNGLPTTQGFQVRQSTVSNGNHPRDNRYNVYARFAGPIATLNNGQGE
jgi:hypothetical protein